MTELPPLPLPEPVTSRMVATESGLDQHILEAGDRDRPLVLLMHGFPEIAFSWRHVMPAIAAAGYWVVAPDHRGAGRTTGWDDAYDTDLGAFSMTNLVRDNLALIRALGRENCHAMIGHDFGAPLTAWTLLVRPDLVGRAMLMSAPFAGAPAVAARKDPLHDDLAALPRPRKHYQVYYCGRSANGDMMGAADGLHAFLRAYYHMKSADWAGNAPETLGGWKAEEFARMPTYYVMDASEDMAETVAHEMPSERRNRSEPLADRGGPGRLRRRVCADRVSGRAQLVPGELGARHAPGPVRLSRQGGSMCRCASSPGARIGAGHSSRARWRAMETSFTSDYRGTRLIDGAGHWVQQEQAEAVAAEIIEYLA